jgi:hypothetical protein
LFDLSGPGGIALVTLEQLAEIASPDGESPEVVEVSSDIGGCWPPGLAARRERDAVE